MKISRREFSVLTSSVLAALAAPRAIADPPRVRRNVNYLSSAEIDVLRAGISAMAALPVEDFRSRLYQSHVHGAPWGWEDIYGDVPETDIYWNQCQHDTLHFLTWHRWYLLYFEQIVRELSGDTNFNCAVLECRGARIPARGRANSRGREQLPLQQLARR